MLTANLRVKGCRACQELANVQFLFTRRVVQDLCGPYFRNFTMQKLASASAVLALASSSAMAVGGPLIFVGNTASFNGLGGITSFAGWPAWAWSVSWLHGAVTAADAQWRGTWPRPNRGGAQAPPFLLGPKLDSAPVALTRPSVFHGQPDAPLPLPHGA